jgi:hypothetical protein
VLGSNSQGLLDPEHGKNVKVDYRKTGVAKDTKVLTTLGAVINTLDSSPWGIPRGLFIGVVRGSGTNVRMTANHLVHT